MSVLVNGARSLFGGTGVEESMLATLESRLNLDNPRALYEFLRALYYNVGEDPFRDIDAFSEKFEGIDGFRNPVHAIVEFYVAVLFPGELEKAHPVVFRDEFFRTRLQDALNKVWKWSNWRTKKRLYVRWAAMLGDIFIQAATHTNRNGDVTGVYMSLVDPAHVTDFEEDERGFIVYIRTDVPKVRRTDTGAIENYWRTEVWRKDDQSFRAWESPLNRPETGIDQLVNQVEEESLEAFGIDFVPFVHAKFIDDGEVRGLAPALVSISKSAEASRMASELHQKLFRYNQPDVQLVSTSRDPDGYAPARVRINWGEPDTRSVAGYARVAIPPAGHEIRPVGATVNYQEHREALNEMMRHIVESDAPELSWYQRQENNQSGRALRIKLIPAITKAVEARENLEAKLAQAHAMCFQLAQFWGLEGFSEQDIGTFENENWDHFFADRDVIPMEEDEEADLMEKRARTAEILFNIGINEEYIWENVLKMTEEEIAAQRTALSGRQSGADRLAAALALGRP